MAELFGNENFKCNHFTLYLFYFHIQALQERIRFLENTQGTSVQALINRITHYGSRRLEDFDKYEALRLAEELVSVGRLLAIPKRRVMTSSQPPSGRKSMCRKSNLRLTSWLFWQIRSLQGSLMPSPKLISHLNVLRHTYVHRIEVIRGFRLPTRESVRNPRPQVYAMLEAVSDCPIFSFRRSRSQPTSSDISVAGSTPSSFFCTSLGYIKVK